MQVLWRNISFIFLGIVLLVSNALPQLQAAERTNQQAFKDIVGHWAYEDIALLSANNIVLGVSTDTFAPDQMITRGEFTAYLVNGLGLKEGKSSPFTDVKQGDWYAGAVGAAVAAGLVQGVSSDQFQPQANMTREQLAVVFVRALQKVAQTPDVSATAALQVLTSFVDHREISAWAENEVAVAAHVKFITGTPDNAFLPQNHASRAEATVMLKRFLDHVNQFEGSDSMAISFEEQVDFVKLLQEHNPVNSTLYAKVNGDRNLDVFVPLKDDRAVQYTFKKDNKDDYIRLQNGAVVRLEGDEKKPVKLFETLHPTSNKEFAIRIAPTDKKFSTEWIPEHNALGTVFAGEQQVYFDEVEIAEWTNNTTMKEVNTVKIVQQLQGVHPQDPATPLADIESIFIIDKNGVSIDTKITWLKQVTVSTGYGMMFPVETSFADKLITSMGNVYATTATDGSTTDLRENDQAISYAYIHNSDGTNGEKNTLVAMTVNDIATTFRQGEANRRGGSVVWLQHRDERMQKLYPHVYHRHTANPGETYEASGTYFVGELPDEHALWQYVQMN